VPVKPKAIRTWRQDEVPSGAKSDPGDAQVIAQYLRLRRHRLRRLEPFSAQTRALRAVVRTRDDLLTQRVAATNQLGAMLDGFWPGANAIFVSLDSQITLAFLERYPTRSRPPSWASDAWPPSWPSAATRAGDRQVSSWPACTPPRPGWWHRRVGARHDALLALVGVLKALNTAIKHLDRWVVAHLGEHPDAKIFTSLPRSGQINAAQLLAEWGDCRPAYAGAEAVAAWAAPARSPSSPASTTPCTFVGRATSASAWRSRPSPTPPGTPALGRQGRPRRHRPRPPPSARRPHPGTRWIRVIWRCWMDSVPYDPAKHGAIRKLAEMAALAPES
jgi:hypothetical protein